MTETNFPPCPHCGEFLAYFISTEGYTLIERKPEPPFVEYDYFSWPIPVMPGKELTTSAATTKHDLLLGKERVTGYPCKKCGKVWYSIPNLIGAYNEWIVDEL